MPSKPSTHRGSKASPSPDVGVMMSSSEAAIWGRLFEPEHDDLSPVEARYLLPIGFNEADKKRAHELLVKNQEDALTAEERAELENYRKVGYLIDLMHAKARRALKKHTSPA